MSDPNICGGYGHDLTIPAGGQARQCATSKPTPPPAPPALTAPAERPAIEAPKEQPK
ncbi:hypothetical protein [Kitasatospora sp. NBC_01302]|uniref:hypothetical protein n=1 Tax=Kitasatospora sp. NBC_01302 TaxID=2903575 RepID=UPI002E13E7BE|nr:hypothetical protein OG294_14220 [Kitasatospora sp. NBC_01302]